MVTQLSMSFVRDVERAIAYQYMLLANLDMVVHQSVCNKKKVFVETWPDTPAIVTSPHITLLHFLGWLIFSEREKLETQLCEFLHNLCCGQYSFPVKLENYEGFSHGAIYICIQNLAAFSDLQNALRCINLTLNTGGCDSAEIINPLHVTLVRGLNTKDYDRILPTYSRQHFHAIFPLKKLTLVRRVIEGDSWQHVKDFYLPNERTLFT